MRVVALMRIIKIVRNSNLLEPALKQVNKVVVVHQDLLLFLIDCVYKSISDVHVLSIYLFQMYMSIYLSILAVHINLPILDVHVYLSISYVHVYLSTYFRCTCLSIYLSISDVHVVREEL